MNEMIFTSSVTAARLPRYRNVDLLLIDDIQFPANKDGTGGVLLRSGRCRRLKQIA
jgi:chromosomal replication initiation ATPase DnaA